MINGYFFHYFHTFAKNKKIIRKIYLQNLSAKFIRKIYPQNLSAKSIREHRTLLLSLSIRPYERIRPDTKVTISPVSSVHNLDWALIGLLE